MINATFLGIFVLVAGFGVRLVIHQKKKGDLMEAYYHARSLGCALFNFAQDYGTYPCDASAVEVLKLNPQLDITFGNATSNDYFRQMIASGHIDTEVSFHAHIAGCHKPDNLMDGSHMLGKNECGFSYIIGPVWDSKPPQPLLVTPLIPGTDRFDPKPFGGKAVILRVDSSVTVLPIDPSGRVIFDGVNLLDPAHPIWAGKTPRIVWPDI